MMSRFKAAAIHLGISLFVVLIFLALMLGVWFPNGFFTLLGGSTLIYLISGVDVTLGPLLTLVVFKAGKKSLKFDLSVIALFQIAALIYGASVMFNSRPVFNVLEENIFKVTLASDFKDSTQLKLAKNPAWRQLSITGPVLVAAVEPTNPKERQAMVFASAAGLDWNVFPALYVDYDTQRDIALKNAKPLADLRKLSSENALVVRAFLKNQNRSEESFVYLPIVSGYIAMTAVLDAKNADFVKIIPITPP